MIWSFFQSFDMKNKVLTSNRVRFVFLQRNIPPISLKNAIPPYCMATEVTSTSEVTYIAIDVTYIAIDVTYIAMHQWRQG